MTARTHRDIYTDVTHKIIAAILADPGAPRLPWRTGGSLLGLPKNALTEQPYNGINVVSLWAAAELAAFAQPVWATYKQWQALGAQVRGGEKSSLIIFYKQFEAEPDPELEDDDGIRRIARASHVFNCAQVDGYAAPTSDPELGPIERRQHVDAFLANTHARIQHGGQRAFYRPATDHIQMPDEGLFMDGPTMTRSEGYYAVLAHETVHWTGAAHRLDRQFGKRFGDAAYAAEELVAELGSAFLASELGFTQDVRQDHAQYLAHWLKLLQDDTKAIFTAAAKASSAVSYLKRLQPACEASAPPQAERPGLPSLAA